MTPCSPVTPFNMSCDQQWAIKCRWHAMWRRDTSNLKKRYCRHAKILTQMSVSQRKYCKDTFESVNVLSIIIAAIIEISYYEFRHPHHCWVKTRIQFNTESASKTFELQWHLLRQRATMMKSNWFECAQWMEMCSKESTDKRRLHIKYIPTTSACALLWNNDAFLSLDNWSSIHSQALHSIFIATHVEATIDRASFHT